MFDCSLGSAVDIREAADVRHEIIEYQIKKLSLLGYKRDVEFIFPDGYYASPNWSYSDELGEDAQEIVRKVYLLCEDIERADTIFSLKGRRMGGGQHNCPMAVTTGRRPYSN